MFGLTTASRKSKNNSQQINEALESLLNGQLNKNIDAENYVGEWKPVAQKIDAFRQLAADLANELQVTSAQVISAVGQMSEVGDQTRELVGVLTGLQSASDTINNLTSGLSEVIQKQSNVLVKANQSLEETTGMTTDVLKKSTDKTNEKLTELKGVVSGVDDILGKIDDISNKTRLLSINASIEAAHAGENGKGFTVIAEEVKRLTDQSSEAVKETEEITKLVNAEIDEVVQTGVDGQEKVLDLVSRTNKEVTDSLQLQQNTINTIVGEVEKVQDKVENYLGKVMNNLDVWESVLSGLDDTTSLMERVGEALNETVEKVNITQEVSLEENMQIEDIKKHLIELSKDPQIQSLDASTHKNIMLDLLKKTPSLESIYSNRKDGTFIFSEPAAGLSNAKVREWWQEAIAGNIYVSPVYISAITRSSCRTVAVPIRDKENDIVGVLAVDLIFQ